MIILKILYGIFLVLFFCAVISGIDDFDSNKGVPKKKSK
jgi:hypothetical protein